MDYIGSDEFRFGAGQPVDPETLRAEALARRRPLNQITTEELTRGFGFGGRSNIPGYSRAEIQAELDRRLSSQFPPGAPAQMYREEAVESTPRNLGTAPPPPPPPPPAQTTARPGAPAVGLPPRVEMGGGNISELVSQRLGQIKPPEETKSFLDNPYLALVQAGLSMIADSRGKSPLEAIAGGGRAGLQTAIDQRAAARALEQRRYVQEMERLKTENEMRRTLGEEEYRRASLGATQRAHDIQERRAAQQEQYQREEAARRDRDLLLRETTGQRAELNARIRDLQLEARLFQAQAETATRAGNTAEAESARREIARVLGEIRDLRGLPGPTAPGAPPTTDMGRSPR